MGVFTSVNDGKSRDGSQDNRQSLIGQMIHLAGSQIAHLTFLAPEPALASPLLLDLLESLIMIARQRGALRLMADVDEGSTTFDPLRGAGFATFTRQRIWQFTARKASAKQAPTLPVSHWQAARSQDAIAVRSLYNNVVPGLVQQIEPFLMQPVPGVRSPQGMIYRHDGELRAYVELKYGHKGIWAQPFVHPDALEAAGALAELITGLPYRYSRPVYICVRTYQAWLEPIIEALGAEAGPRLAVMVKHLAVAQKAQLSYAIPALEGGQTEITASIVRDRME
jgi:hypothetical protein